MSSTDSNNVKYSDTAAVSQAAMFVDHNDPTLRFTATSLPIRPEVPPNSGMMAGGIGYYPRASQSSNLNEDEIMTVPVTVTKGVAPPTPANEKHGFMGKLKDLVGSSSADRGGEGKLRIVHMPRREYLKYFARDAKRNYVGSEPERSWTDEELDEMFAQYEPAPLPKAKGTLLDKLLSPLGGGVQY